MSVNIMGFDGPIGAIIIGGRGGVGAAMARQVALANPRNQVVATSRDDSWTQVVSEVANIRRMTLDLTDETSCSTFASQVNHPIQCVVNCSGLLHDAGIQPERTWRHLDPKQMAEVFAVNSIAVAMAVKHLLPLIGRQERGVFASLSARVGSISDNRLGGWYSYRASKAAQHMILKCAAIEASRLYPNLTCVALHPGTVDTALSQPFTSRTPAERLFTPEKSAGHLLDVLAALGPTDSGGVFAWDGTSIEY